MRHILARFAIAARGGLYQHTIFVSQAHGKAIKFEFSYVLNRGIGITKFQFFANPCIKVFCATTLGIRFGADTEHRHGMFDLAKSIQQTTTHTLRGGVLCFQIWMREL